VALWDVYQQLQIRGQRVAANAIDRESVSRDQRLDMRIDEVEDRIDKILMINEAMWELARDRLGLSDDQLDAAVRAIIDRKVMERAAGPKKCASCGAAVPIEMARCQFCGADAGPAITQRFGGT
jgi:hypothetical protein